MVNKAILLGTVQETPVGQTVGQSGAKIARFTVITTEQVEGKEPVPSYHRVVAWNKNAEICQKYLAKGSKVLIEGKINYGSYTGKDGVKRYTTDIVAQRVNLLDGQSAKEEEPESVVNKPENYDDIPF